VCINAGTSLCEVAQNLQIQQKLKWFIIVKLSYTVISSAVLKLLHATDDTDFKGHCAQLQMHLKIIFTVSLDSSLNCVFSVLL
jgi:hypothetical protein